MIGPSVFTHCCVWKVGSYFLRLGEKGAASFYIYISKGWQLGLREKDLPRL